MILVFGTICLDRLRRVARLPSPGGYAEVLEEDVALGGEAANTANALRVWGAQVALYGNRFTPGPEAELLQGLLDRHSLTNMSVPASTRAHRGPPVCDIYVTPDGERTMFGLGFGASDGSLDVRDVPYAKGQWFTVEPNMSKTSREAARLASSAGMKMYYLDFFQLDEEIASGSVCQTSTDWVGLRGDSAANIEWCEAWSSRHRCTTILTNGSRGLFVSLPSRKASELPAFPAPSMMDSTGAGDLFRAGMLFGLERGDSLADCLRFAAATGALSCRSVGATVDVPSPAEIRRLIAANPDISSQYEKIGSEVAST